MDELLFGKRNAQTGIGEPDAAVRPADDIVGAVDPLALIAVHQHRHTTVGRDAGDPPVTAFADHQPALQIEGRAVALAGLTAHDLRRLARPQPEQQAPADVDEIVEAVGVPRRSFGEDEICCQAFRRARLQDVV